MPERKAMFKPSPKIEISILLMVGNVRMVKIVRVVNALDNLNDNNLLNHHNDLNGPNLKSFVARILTKKRVSFIKY